MRREDAGEGIPDASADLVLLNPPFHRVRYAWSAPWATRMSSDDDPYGDVLVRIELKPEAIVVAYHPLRDTGRRWAFFGPDGRELSSAEAMASAGRIGAIYHSRDIAGMNQLSMREFLVCNEAMVAWAFSNAARWASTCMAAMAFCFCKAT